jgi:hypothetical protein
MKKNVVTFKGEALISSKSAAAVQRLILIEVFLRADTTG